MSEPTKLKRRDMLLLAGGATGLVVGGFAGFTSKMVFPQRLVYGFGSAAPVQPTPRCIEAGATASYEEGPFYTPNTPARTDFRLPGHGGREVLLRGLVTDECCRPIAGAVLDFWHADERAAYDNVNYDYRGHQFTASDGSFSLRTLVPPPYAFAGLWRAPHIHVKAQGPRTRLLTTQLFFPDPSGVTRHVEIDRSLAVQMSEPVDRVEQAFFHLVLRQS